MTLKNTIQKKICHVVLIILSMVLLGQSIHAEQKAIREEVQDAIRQAETLKQEGKYAEALRLLFDAMYKEQRVYPLSPPPYSPYAAETLITLEQSLIHEDPSPLLQYFRDSDVPIEQKLAYIRELRTYVWQTGQDGEEITLDGKKYRGTLVQLLHSRKLSTEEKIDVLFWIDEMVREQYTSEIQRQQIQQDIARLREMAEQKFQDRQYVEAFVLHEEAIRKTEIIRDNKMGLFEESAHMIEVFFESDESPLMQLFKSQQIPAETKQRLVAEIRRQLSPGTKTLFFEGKEYDGPLVQIFSHPKISGTLKLSILDRMEIMSNQ